jgi:nitronate monooxygenase
MIQLDVPIVLAPLAGGPGTPELAAAVSNAGGLGFLPAGYLTAAAMRDRIAATRRLTDRPLGVNVFVPGAASPDGAVEEYAAALAETARRAGTELGKPRFDDDDWQAKLDVLTADPLPVTSFTFGCPEPGVVAAVQAAGSQAWVTVTTPAEALQAEAAGADALVLQGSEAGGHRGSFTDDPSGDDGFGLLALLQLVRARTSLPLVAAGGVGTGAGVAAVLAAGASAAQLGTAFVACPESSADAGFRAALLGPASRHTVMTSVISGRPARSLVNRFTELGDSVDARAIPSYPIAYDAGKALHAAAWAMGESGYGAQWAGQGAPLARSLPAAILVAELRSEMERALSRRVER